MPIVRKVQTSEQFEQLIERYKVQNPVKFAGKKDALMAKLAELKKMEGKDEKPKK